LFDGTGVQELNGTSVNINLRGVRVGIAGVGVLNELGTDRALAGIPPDAFKIFLYHYPDLMRALADRRVDLYLAGHTHGGQIALPFYGALMTLSSYGKKYEAGLFHDRATWLYVNRGIGMEGGVPRVRFWAPPEVTVIDVIPAVLVN
jgi:predicted MPP superfamily phosphohydrolase